MAYANVKSEKANHLMRKIPYTIIPGEEGKLRKDIFLELSLIHIFPRPCSNRSCHMPGGGASESRSCCT